MLPRGYEGKGRVYQILARPSACHFGSKNLAPVWCARGAVCTNAAHEQIVKPGQYFYINEFIE
jgi:hypothetical protein